MGLTYNQKEKFIEIDGYDLKLKNDSSNIQIPANKPLVLNPVTKAIQTLSDISLLEVSYTQADIEGIGDNPELTSNETLKDLSVKLMLIVNQLNTAIEDLQSGEASVEMINNFDMNSDDALIPNTIFKHNKKAYVYTNGPGLQKPIDYFTLTVSEIENKDGNNTMYIMQKIEGYCADDGIDKDYPVVFQRVVKINTSTKDKTYTKWYQHTYIAC